MLALSSLPGLSIETSTSKVVTLSFSTPIGEICVTLPSNVLVLERLDGDPRRLPQAHAADVGLVHLAADEHPVDVAERHHQRRLGAQVEDRRHRAADLDVARQHRAADRRPDGRVGQLLFGALDGGAVPARRWPRLGDLGLRDDELPWPRAGGSRPARALCASSSACGDQLLREQLIGALEVRAARTRRRAPRPRSRSSSAAPPRRVGRLGGLEVRPRLAQARGEFLLVELGEHLPRRDHLIDVDEQRSMMPFAFDLISTLVIGSILPVATTERVIVARSTVASRDGSIVEDAPRRVGKSPRRGYDHRDAMPAIRLPFSIFITGC